MLQSNSREYYEGGRHKKAREVRLPVRHWAILEADHYTTDASANTSNRSPGTGNGLSLQTHAYRC